MSLPRSANGHRRRQVVARVKREEDICGICGTEVDKTLPYLDPTTGKPHPMAATIDEIIPVSLGGSAIDRTNCRLAHRICNLRRGNATSTKALAIQVKRARTY